MYKNNKGMITNLREIENVCGMLLKCLGGLRAENVGYSSCKILNLLEMLITLRHKTIEANKNIIINQILKREFTNVLEVTSGDPKGKTNYPIIMYDVIMFSLMNSLNQPSLKKKFINKY